MFCDDGKRVARLERKQDEHAGMIRINHIECESHAPAV